MIKKILIWIVVIFLSAILFLPGFDGKFRNLPILFTAVAIFILFWLVRHIRTWILTCKVLLLLRSKYLSTKKVLVFFKTAYIVAEGKGCVYFFTLYRGIKQKYRYHFEKPDILEIYKTTRASYVGGKVHGKMFRGTAMTTLVKRKRFLRLKLTERKQAYKIIVTDPFPEVLTDAVNDLRRDPLGQGEALCNSDTIIYSFDGLKEYFDAE